MNAILSREIPAVKLKKNLSAFYINFCNKNLTEIGALLLKFDAYFQDPDIAWQNVTELEERLTTHIDALDVHREHVQYCAADFLTSNDGNELVGSIYALTRSTLIRSKSDDNACQAAINAFTATEDDFLHHYVYTLKYAQNPAIDEMLIELLDCERTTIRLACIEILGYRRCVHPNRIWSYLGDADARISIATMVALMRLGYRPALPALEQLLHHSDIQNVNTENVDSNKSLPADELLIVMLTLGSQQALQALRKICTNSDNFNANRLIYLSIAGNASDLNLLVQAIQRSELATVAYEAIGLLGAIKSIPVLLEGLESENKEEKRAAANALNIITGANLQETIVRIEHEEPDFVVEDFLMSLHGRADQNQNSPLATEIDVQKSVIDITPWQDWWQLNQTRFDPNLRYRDGRPFDLGSCIMDMVSSTRTYSSRQQAYLELIIRSGHSIFFEPDWFVSKQISAIDHWQKWWKTHKMQYSGNQWLFGGK